MTYLYWLHLPEHTDILTQGYIGVSARLKKRLWEHRKTTENPHLLRAFIKYKNIIHTILLQGPEDYCYEIEEKLRPLQNIGWNINKGGTKPPSLKGRKSPWTTKRLLENHPMKNPTLAMKHGDKRAQDWKLIDPQKKIWLIHNLQKFCKDNNLNRINLTKVANGEREHSKGWTCQRV